MRSNKLKMGRKVRIRLTSRIRVRMTENELECK